MTYFYFPLYAKNNSGLIENFNVEILNSSMKRKELNIIFFYNLERPYDYKSWD